MTGFFLRLFRCAQNRTSASILLGNEKILSRSKRTKDSKRSLNRLSSTVMKRLGNKLNRCLLLSARMTKRPKVFGRVRLMNRVLSPLMSLFSKKERTKSFFHSTSKKELSMNSSTLTNSISFLSKVCKHTISTRQTTASQWRCKL